MGTIEGDRDKRQLIDMKGDDWDRSKVKAIKEKKKPFSKKWRETTPWPLPPQDPATFR